MKKYYYVIESDEYGFFVVDGEDTLDFEQFGNVISIFLDENMAIEYRDFLIENH